MAFTVAAASATSALMPGDHAPAFTLRTLQSLNFEFPTPDQSSVVMHAYDSTDAFSVAMWSGNFSIDSFLLDMLTVNTSGIVVIGSIGGTRQSPKVAEEEVEALQAAITTRTVAMGWSPVQSQIVLSRIVFTPDPVHTWPAWLPATLAAWPQNISTVQSPALASPATRLDGEYAVFPWPAEPFQGPSPLIDLGDGCAAGMKDSGGLPDLNGSVALVSFAARPDGYPVDCPFVNMTLLAQLANASAVVLFPHTGQPGDSTPIAMPNCSASDAAGACAAQVAIPPTTVSAATGLALRAACAAPGGTTITLASVPAAAKELLIEWDGAVRQAGWRKHATARTLSWAAQFADYRHRLAANVSRPAVAEVRALANATVQGRVGAVANVSMPSRTSLQASEVAHIVVDFALGCVGILDESCPVWDRIMAVTACCGAASSPAGQCAPFELARYITPFRRGAGRWLTDVTPLYPLLLPSESSVCGLQVQTDWWAPTAWTATLSIRFEAAAPLGAGGAGEGLAGLRGATAPKSAAASVAASAGHSGAPSWGLSDAVSPLFRGGVFDSQYNNRTAVTLRAPVGTTRALLVAVITGHGSDAEGCAEFCPTTHVFQVGSTNVSVSFSDAGDFWGSTYSILDGTIPNQHGTWAFGRDGWYDGNKVRQWRQDVTSLAVGKGDVNVQYWGLFRGASPAVTGGSAVIDMWSWIVWYK